MINLYTNSSQTVETQVPIAFTTVGLRKNTKITQSTETTTQLNCPGVYLITFNGTAAATTIAQLYINGEAIPGALANGVSLGFSTLVKVNPNCCAITDNLPSRVQILNVDSGSATYSNVSLTIVKVG